MSEEEAIKICKNIIRSINGETCFIGYSKEQDKEAIETILNLYNKQQKQIEEYKSGETFTAKQMHYIEENYIDKDKIRDKLLKPIKEELSKLGETFMNKDPEILTRSFEVEGTAMQELSWAKGRIEELLEEK